jgi:hypothetical protein
MRQCRSQKSKNLQELYTAAPSIVGLTGRGLIPAALCEGVRMDAIYLLILVGLYLTTHGLVRAFGRLGKTS